MSCKRPKMLEEEALSSSKKDHLQYLQYFSSLCDKDREDFLHELFSICGSPEFCARWAKILSELAKVDFIEKCPSDITFMILRKMPVDTILTCRLVSRGWEQKVSNSYIWVELCKRSKFHVAMGSSPTQYMQSFLYLRHRLQNFTNNIENIDITERCRTGHGDLSDMSYITYMDYYSGRLLYGTQGTENGSLHVLDGRKLSTILNTEVSYKPDIVRLYEKVIICGSYDKDTDENKIYVHDSSKGYLLEQFSVTRTEDWTEPGIAGFDYNERLGIIACTSHTSAGLWELSSGNQLMWFNFPRRNSQEDIVKCSKIALAVPSKETSPNLQIYFVFLSMQKDDTSYSSYIKGYILDAKTHVVLQEEVLFSGKKHDSVYETKVFEEGNDLFVRIMVSKDEANAYTDSENMAILTFAVPRQSAFSSVGANNFGQLLYSDKLSCKCFVQVNKGDFYDDIRLVDFPHTIIGTGSAYHMLTMTRQYRQRNFSMHQDFNISLWPSDDQKADNPALPEQDFPAAPDVPLPLVEPSDGENNRKVPQIMRQNLAWFPQRFPPATSYWTLAESQWLNGLGNGIDSGPILFYKSGMGKRLYVIRWKPSKFESFNSGY